MGFPGNTKHFHCDDVFLQEGSDFMLRNCKVLLVELGLPYND